jgi:hypothetical protein
MLDVQHLDGVLQHRHQVQVGWHHLVGDVAVDEHLPGHHPREGLDRNPAVGTPDEQEMGFLLGCMPFEEGRVVASNLLDQGAVVLKQTTEILH